MVVTYYDGSFFDQQLDAWRTALERTSVSEPYSMYAGEPATTEQITNVGFMALLWAAFGALLYFFAAACVNAFRSRGHVHMRNAQLLAIAFVHLLIRGLALCVLLLGLWIFIHKIILYAFGAAYVAGINADGWQGTGLILLSLLLLATGMHMLVVLLRLFLLRPRLFHSTVYRS